MIFMRGIADRGEEGFVTGRAADIFRRHTIDAVDALHGQQGVRALRVTILDDNEVMPVIAEVIDIFERSGDTPERFVEFDAPLVPFHDRKVEVVIGVG